MSVKPFKQTLFYCSNDSTLRNLISETMNDSFIVRTFKDGQELLNATKNAISPQVVLIDYSCNNLSDDTVSKKIKFLYKNIQIIPVLENNKEIPYKELFEQGFCEPLVKPFSINELNNRIQEAIKHSVLLSSDESEFFITLTFANLEELRDKLTRGHNTRIGLISYEVAKELGCKGVCCDSLKKAATLHDVGKHGIPESILNKNGKLSLEEFNLIKNHTTMGYQILYPSSNLHLNTLLMASEIALKHHEKLDGTGYPSNLTNDQIPVYVRIVTMADIYDACTAKRTYHESRTHKEGMEVLYEEVKNNKLDSKIFKAFYNCSNEIQKIETQYDYSKLNGNIINSSYSLSSTCLECYHEKIINENKKEN